MVAGFDGELTIKGPFKKSKWNVPGTWKELTKEGEKVIKPPAGTTVEQKGEDLFIKLNLPPPPPIAYTFEITVTDASEDARSISTPTDKYVISLTDLAAPAPADVAGVGSDTTENLFDQFSVDYNAIAPASAPQLYSWDATNPATGAIGDTIVIKGTSTDETTCAQARPDGSSAGITALETTNPTIDGHPCIDFARSSRARSATDPTTISFVNLAGDAVGYATEPSASGGPSNVPSNLTTAELLAIYSCKVTNWDQLPGGGNGTPEIFIPQTGSGTRAFFLSAIGGSSFTPGACANDLPTTADPGGTLEENEGTNPAFANNPQNVIFPFSIGKYLAEAFHSASCGTASQCFANPTNCTPAKGQNLFGCDTHGRMQLQEVNGTQPTTPFPPTAKSVINPAFSAGFTRTLFIVVKSAEGTIPSYLAPLFGPTGYTCTNKTAQTDLKNYGFKVLPTGTAAGDCGFAQ